MRGKPASMKPSPGWISILAGVRLKPIGKRFGPAIAHDRLQAAYHYLVDGLFAYNRRWRIWRNRQMSGLLQLPWLPNGLADDILLVANAPSLDYAGYMARVEQAHLLL